MEVIFVKTIHGVGTKGNVRNVKPGFFRNYLLPKGMAVLATPQMKTFWEKRKELALIAKGELKVRAIELQKRLEGKTFRIQKKVTKKGTLYGAVTGKDIAGLLSEQAQIQVDPKTLVVKETIKQVGIASVPLQLAEGVEATISLDVQPLESEK